MVGIVLLGVFVLLLALGAPIAVCLGMSSVSAILVQGAGKPLEAIMSVLPRLCSSASSKFVLLAIPFFILSGNVMEKAGISGRLINLAEKCLGHIRGGMAMVCVVVSCFFAAISGSGPATVAALGLIMIPALVKAGYPASFSCALMAAVHHLRCVRLHRGRLHHGSVRRRCRTRPSDGSRPDRGRHAHGPQDGP